MQTQSHRVMAGGSNSVQPLRSQVGLFSFISSPGKCFLSCFLLASALFLPQTEGAVEDSFEAGGLIYQVLTEAPLKTVSVTGSLEDVVEVQIPSQVSYQGGDYTVTAIESNAFAWRSALTSIVIADSVASLGDEVFSECSSLESVTLGSGVSSLGWNVFDRCNSLERIDVSKSNLAYSSLEGVLFSKDATHLLRFPEGKAGSYTVPAGVLSIDEYAFWSSEHLQSLELADTVLVIGGNAFSWCPVLTDVKIGNSVTFIGESAFYNCPSLQSIVIPDSVTTIGGGLFGDCPGLKSATLGSGLKTLSYEMFMRCSGLTDIVIPDSVEEIAEGAFRVCNGLKSVVIGKNVASIGGGAFSGCSNLANLELGQSVVSIGVGAFSSCESLTAVNIPEGVTSIAADTFFGCFKLKSVEIAGNLTTIGDNAFLGCIELQGFEIPQSVTSMGMYAFSYCSSLSSIDIPEGVVSISQGLFAVCEGLLEVKLPDSVTTIEDNAFIGCIGLRSIEIPQSVTSIRGGAFSGCSSLLGIKIPEGVVSIKDSTFSNCTSLSSVEICDNVVSIERMAFFGCTALKRVSLGRKLDVLGSEVFGSCPNLMSLFFEGNVPEGVQAGTFSGINPDGKVYYLPEAGGWPESGAYWHGMQVFEWMPPVIVTQPVGRDALQGNRVALSVVATSSEPLQYQWMKDGVQIPGANESFYLIKSALPDNAGTYTVEVSCESGYVLSEPAVLTVAPQDAWLSFDRVEGKLILTFGGSLQESDDGLSWSDNLEVLSPWEVSISGSKKFYRSTLVRP